MKRAGRAGRAMRRRLLRRLTRPRLRVNDYAGVSESIPFQGRNVLVPPTSSFITFNTPGTQVYTMADLTLGAFTRASAVAQGYQFYRIKYLELAILPSTDTFAGGTAVKPYFYYMVDKGNALPLALVDTQVKQLGAKAIALDEKPIHIRWKPGVSLSTEISTTTGATSAQKYMVSPWLNCDEDPNTGTFNASQVVHNGLKFFAENIGGTQVSYTGTITAHFQFKKPCIPAVADTQASA